MAPLGLLTNGERGEVLEMRAGKCTPDAGRSRQLCHIEDIGLRAGKMVEMLNNEGKGSILIRVDESRIALGRGIAMKIMVRRVEQ
jgi:ferrous iron transport protein A